MIKAIIFDWGGVLGLYEGVMGGLASFFKTNKELFKKV